MPNNIDRKTNADRLLYEYGLMKRLEEIGKPHIIGSYRMDMMAWNDLDIDIENDTMSLDKIYDLFPVMEESDEFGLSILESTLKPMLKTGAVDFGNLTNCRLTISTLVIDEDVKPLNYEYFIDLREKESDNTYIGNVYGLKLTPGQGKRQFETDALGRKIKSSLGKVRAFVNVAEGEITVSLQCYSFVDEDWMLPYYDTKTKEVIHCDNNLLETHGSQERFQMIDEDRAFYIIDTNKLKRIG